MDSLQKKPQRHNKSYLCKIIPLTSTDDSSSIQAGFVVVFDRRCSIKPETGTISIVIRFIEKQSLGLLTSFSFFYM